MSYRCDKCNAVYDGTELVVPTVIREVNYHQHTMRFNPKERRKEPNYNTTFKGWETVKRERLCESCYKENKDCTPEIDAPKNVNFFSRRPSKSRGTRQNVKERLENNRGKKLKSFKDL